MKKKRRSDTASWRVILIRKKGMYLGRVSAPDEGSALQKAAEEFGIERERRKRLAAQRVKGRA